MFICREALGKQKRYLLYIVIIVHGTEFFYRGVCPPAASLKAAGS